MMYVRKEWGIIMSQELKTILLIVLALAFTVYIQVRTSKLRNPYIGLMIPILFFIITLSIFIADLHHIFSETIETDMTGITATLYFALYNIPTILLLCIYNYYQRMPDTYKKRSACRQ